MQFSEAIEIKNVYARLKYQKRALMKTNHGAENLKSCNYSPFVLLLVKQSHCNHF